MHERMELPEKKILSTATPTTVRNFITKILVYSNIFLGIIFFLVVVLCYFSMGSLSGLIIVPIGVIVSFIFTIYVYNRYSETKDYYIEIFSDYLVIHGKKDLFYGGSLLITIEFKDIENIKVSELKKYPLFPEFPKDYFFHPGTSYKNLYLLKVKEFSNLSPGVYIEDIKNAEFVLDIEDISEFRNMIKK